ncbi:lactonase family protein [uncultured Polaribacter sp.]|uniref:lactonase family protein n=1 Tax=uncultured Polaribacter sp. TaxID=174711 RepID=UPI002611614E|nr:lactonase family protein [uncultured Polaribacter sp.]
MKNLYVFFCFFAIVGCKTSKLKNNKNLDFYVGTFTDKESKGIYKYSLTNTGKLTSLGLVAAVKNPNFITKSKDNKTLFAVGETTKEGKGVIRSYNIKESSLEFINSAETGGAVPCYVTANHQNYILTANYVGGNVGLLSFKDSGQLNPLHYVQQHTGKGSTNRQKKPHAHSVWFHPTKNEVISANLGTNELWFSKIDKAQNKLMYTHQKKLKMVVGAGPRHLVFHPNNKWFYVLNELNNTVSLIKEKNNMYYVDFSIRTLPKDFKAFSKAADIHISKDGKFLYASNRGHESIVIYNVNSKSGKLNVIDYQNVLGEHPRNFSLSPDNKYLLVANQDTNTIISFKRNTANGKLTFTDKINAPTPVCILF